MLNNNLSNREKNSNFVSSFFYFTFFLAIFLILALFYRFNFENILKDSIGILKALNLFVLEWIYGNKKHTYDTLIEEPGFDLTRNGYFFLQTIFFISSKWIASTVGLVVFCVGFIFLKHKLTIFLNNDFFPKISGRKRKARNVSFSHVQFDAYDEIIQRKEYLLANKKTFLGFDASKGNGKKTSIFITDKVRRQHTQVLGRTGTGKTESYSIPLFIQDALKGYPVVFFDGKSELSILEKIIFYLDKVGKKNDLLLFSLIDKNSSCSFNPFFISEGIDPKSIREVFFACYKESGFSSESDYYLNFQKNSFDLAFDILCEIGSCFNILDLWALLKNEKARNMAFAVLTDKGTGLNLIQRLNEEIGKDARAFNEKNGCLLNFLLEFSDPIFNSYDPDIVLDDVLRSKKLVYFQLPINMYPLHSKLIGKLVQTNVRLLSSAIQAELLKDEDGTPFQGYSSIIFEEFKAFADLAFLDTLQLCRSSNMMVTVSSQTYNDLNIIEDGLGAAIKAAVHTLLIFRQNDSSFCEEVCKDFGTWKVNKITEVSELDFVSDMKSGMASNREIDEFIIHPNMIKNLAQKGQAILIRDNEYFVVNFGFFPDARLAYQVKKKEHSSEKGLSLYENVYFYKI